MSLSLSLFGAPTVDDGHSAVALPFERRGQLLAFLALKRSWVGRGELAALLWPGQDTKLALTNLRKALFRLQTFAWHERVETQGGSLRFEVDTDVFAFELALRENRVADALALRRGELLAGYDDPANDRWTTWLAFERDRLRAAWRSAVNARLAEADVPQAVAVDLAAQLLADDPLDEAALRTYMAWLVRSGQSGLARQTYNDFVGRLREELGLAPNAELQALHESIVHPTPAAASARPATRDESFVGRTVELRRIETLLAQDDCRLLCITGPGGVGKTRLARRVLEGPGLRFAGGAFFVPVEDVPVIGELGRRLARELGITLATRGEPLDQVMKALGSTPTLLVLDNFEHLAGDAAALEKLLAACSGLKLVVTTRERLSLPGEWLMPLDGLPYPDLEDAESVEAFDAVRLFLRAARRIGSIHGGNADAAAIIDICRQVEGLPLALELAASWTRVLTCEEIAAELRQGTELLRATDTSQPARHASMNVVFEQSWRLLSDVERDALPRLTVFGGGFSATAARAVAGASLPVLGALADKSLLRKDASRVHLHPLVQQLAAARLTDAPRTQAREAHARYFHRLLAQLASRLAIGEKEALQTVDDEFDNVRRTWRWSIEVGDADALAATVVPLNDHCDARGRFNDGLALLEEALGAAFVKNDAKLYARLLARAAHLEYRLDRYANAQANANAALAATRRNADPGTRRQACTVLGACALRLGRLEDARKHFKQGLAEALPGQEAHAQAVTLDHLALVEKAMGNYAEAQRLSRESLAQHRSLGDVAGVALCLSNLGQLNIVLHDYAAAETYLREALAICEQAGIVNTQAFALANLVEVALRRNALDEAAAFARKGLEVAGTTGNRTIVALMNMNLAVVAARRRELEEARAALAEGLSLAITLGANGLKFEGIASFAEVLEAQGEAAGARQVLALAADAPTANEMTRGEIRARLAALAPLPQPVAPYPAIAFDDLIHRIVAESGAAYAPLIAALRAAG